MYQRRSWSKYMRLSVFTVCTCTISKVQPFNHAPKYCISFNRRRPQKVAAQKKCHPWIVATASIAIHAHVCKWFLATVTMLVLGLFMSYQSFSRLTAGLRGCTCYRQRLTVVTVSLVHALSSCHWCLRAFRRNKCCPRIVAAQNEQQKK